MKQCKVCGTLVHIDSNTCPSCGNHNFFVLDVKICPLCGKVNGISNSFCEQCGKPFVTAQGGAYIKRPVAKRPVPANYPRIFNQGTAAPMPQQQQTAEPVYQQTAEPAAPVYQQQPAPVYQQPAQPATVYQQPAPAEKSAGVEERSARQAYKDFVALKPEVIEGDDYSEVSYYVKGDGEKLPVIILPKFARQSGQNITVNIVVDPKNKDATAQVVTAPAIEVQPASAVAPIQAQSAPVYAAPVYAAPVYSAAPAAYQAPATPAQSAPVQVDVAAEDDKAKEFRPFSAIEDSDEQQLSAQAKPFEDSDKPATKKQRKVKAAKKMKKAKKPVTGGKVVVSLLMLIFALGIIAGYALPLYKNFDQTTGLSAMLFTLDKHGLAVSVPITGHDGFSQFLADVLVADSIAGLPLLTGVPQIIVDNLHYALSGAAVLAFILAILTLFSFRHKKGLKVLFVIFGLLNLLVFAVAVAAIAVVFEGLVFMDTLGLGLIISSAAALLFFIFAVFFMRTGKKKQKGLSSL